MAERPARYVTADDYARPHPVYAVWEITLKCDLACHHCGSRAGRARSDELSTEECLEVVAALARLGTREVTIIGGEAYLRKDWTTIIRAIRAAGMDCTMTTGGRNLSEERIAAAAEAGLQGVSISVDGTEATHDRIRNVAGSHRNALHALSLLKRHGIIAGCNTQIHRLSMRELPQIMDDIIGAGATNWQVQLTVAMGNAVDNAELLIQPYELLEIYPVLADLYMKGMERGLYMQPGNNIGYFGPYELLWRGDDDGSGHWGGCTAGINGIGLEADGTIKGCPSLPTSTYSGGNIRDLSLEAIWNDAATMRVIRDRTNDALWGYCKTCYYADVCKAGCTWTTHVLFGKPGNNPYCHYRALELQKRGVRERVVKVQDAPGLPFDNGLFELREEPFDAPIVESEVRIPAPRRRASRLAVLG
jgi:radical SAM protein with 4Fe4S-binding SPASM domain